MIYIEQVKKDIFLISMDIETFTNYGIDINQFLDDDIDGVYKEETIELDNNDDSNLYQVLNSFTTNINDIFHIALNKESVTSDIFVDKELDVVIICIGNNDIDDIIDLYLENELYTENGNQLGLDIRNERIQNTDNLHFVGKQTAEGDFVPDESLELDEVENTAKSEVRETIEFDKKYSLGMTARFQSLEKLLNFIQTFNLDIEDTTDLYIDEDIYYLVISKNDKLKQWYDNANIPYGEESLSKEDQVDEKKEMLRLQLSQKVFDEYLYLQARLEELGIDTNTRTYLLEELAVPIFKKNAIQEIKRIFNI